MFLLRKYPGKELPDNKGDEREVRASYSASL